MRYVASFPLLIVLVISCLSLPKTVAATTGDVDYSVEAIDHPKQLNQQLSYFDLMIEPEEKTTLDIMIHNETNQTEEFDVSFVDAFTNGNGLIVYEKKNVKKQSSLSVKNFSNERHQQVQVRAFSSKKVTIPIQVPSDSFKGAFLGGIRVEKQIKDEQKDHLGINNRYVYVIGVKLSMGLMKESFEPAWKGVTLNTKSYYPALEYRMKNQTASISSPLKVELVLKKGKEVVTRQKMDARFVPLGDVALRLQLQKELKQGKYTTYLKLYDTEHRKTWEWKDQITITDKEEATVNKHLKKEDNPTDRMSWIWIVSTAVIGLVFCALAGYIYYLRKQLSSPSRRIV